MSTMLRYAENQLALSIADCHDFWNKETIEMRCLFGNLRVNLTEEWQSACLSLIHQNGLWYSSLLIVALRAKLLIMQFIAWNPLCYNSLNEYVR